MNQYYVLWTYIANYSRLIPVKADTPQQALRETCGYFGEDFQKKASVFVFDHPPVLIQCKGDHMVTVAKYRELTVNDR